MGFLDSIYWLYLANKGLNKVPSILGYFYNPGSTKYSTTSTSVPGNLMLQKPKVVETPISENNTGISRTFDENNTAVSQTFDSPNPLVTETRSLEDIINGVKNPYKEPDSLPIIGKDLKEKKNAPPANDNKIVESYEKDPTDELLGNLSTKNIENWINSRHRTDEKSGNLLSSFRGVLNNPDLLGIGRLAVNLGYNNKIYDEYLKGLNPTLKLSYHTYRQVFGDEATKLGYYRRAALLLTKAAQPFTSNAETLLAAMFDAYDKGNQMRSEGDLADNKMIRETSELANQHLDANRQRDTEVANYNIAAMNQTKAQKHALLAQKLSAEGSSIDNWLAGIEARKAKDEALRKKLNYNIYALLSQSEIENDPTLNSLREEYEAASKLPINLKKDMFGLTVINYDSKLMKDIKRRLLQRMREIYSGLYQYMYDNGIYYGKSGVKITRKVKEKDDLLYKSARDVVEHFRKMIALDKKASKHNNKIERLAPHPKGSTKKYLLGGVAPFLVYKPITLGGETTTSVSTDTSSTSTRSSSKTADDTSKDLMKQLFLLLQVEGLPSDTNAIYSAMNNLMQQRDMFGDSISTEDLSTMFVLLMSRVNMIKYNKALFDKIADIVHNKNADSEIAITPDGRIAVLDTDTMKIEYKRYSDINPKKHVVLTNYLLLNIRALSPSMAFDSGMVLMTAANATSMEEIAKFLKALLPAIESSESSILGYTKKDTADIKSGIRTLLLDAPEGVYEYLMENKTNQILVRKALEYLYKILPDNMRTLLDIKSGGQSGLLIATMLGAKEFTNIKTSVDAVTGGSSNGNKTGSSSGTDTPSVVLFLLGNGYSEMINFDIGNSLSIKVLGRFGILQDKEKKNLGQGSTFLDVSSSLFGPVLDMDKATFGGSRLNTNGFSHIIINNSDIVGVDLPVTTDISGNKVPNFLLLNNIEKAEEEIYNNKITNKELINLIYNKYNLPNKYDNNGNIILQNYLRFAAIHVTLDSKALKGLIPINMNEVSEADDQERELFIETMNKNGIKDYDLNDGILWTSWGRDKLYKGTVFIPVREDLVSGYISGGSPLDTDIPNNANQVQIMLHAPKVLQYNSAGNLSLLMNN